MAVLKKKKQKNRLWAGHRWAQAGPPSGLYHCPVRKLRHRPRQPVSTQGLEARIPHPEVPFWHQPTEWSERSHVLFPRPHFTHLLNEIRGWPGYSLVSPPAWGFWCSLELLRNTVECLGCRTASHVDLGDCQCTLSQDWVSYWPNPHPADPPSNSHS